MERPYGKISVCFHPTAGLITAVPGFVLTQIAGSRGWQEQNRGRWFRGIRFDPQPQTDLLGNKSTRNSRACTAALALAEG